MAINIKQRLTPTRVAVDLTMTAEILGVTPSPTVHGNWLPFTKAPDAKRFAEEQSLAELLEVKEVGITVFPGVPMMDLERLKIPVDKGAVIVPPARMLYTDMLQFGIEIPKDPILQAPRTIIDEAVRRDFIQKHPEQCYVVWTPDMQAACREEHKQVCCMVDYQWRGFFKESCGHIRRWDGALSKQLSAYKTVITGAIFIEERYIPLTLPDEKSTTGWCERPLRADTAQGPRVALAKSQTFPVGTRMHFTVRLMSDVWVPYLYEWMASGIDKGTGQWRSGGKGRFDLNKFEVNGKPYNQEDYDKGADKIIKAKKAKDPEYIEAVESAKEAGALAESSAEEFQAERKSKEPVEA